MVVVLLGMVLGMVLVVVGMVAECELLLSGLLSKGRENQPVLGCVVVMVEHFFRLSLLAMQKRTNFMTLDMAVQSTNKEGRQWTRKRKKVWKCAANSITDMNQTKSGDRTSGSFCKCKRHALLFSYRYLCTLHIEKKNANLTSLAARIRFRCG